MAGNDLSDIKLIFNSTKKDYAVPFFTVEEIQKVKEFHETIGAYNETPLVSLKELAYELGLGGIYVKDESKRARLNSFKMLGGAYAISKLLCEKLQINIEDTTFSYLRSNEVKNKIGDLTFVTCSDGNHGRGVAWTANKLGYKAVIYLPKGTAKSRVEAIEKLGAAAEITDLNYDDTIRYAAEMAEKNNWEIVQDTSWDGYDKVPRWIMQGYAVMAYEAFEQIKRVYKRKPTHMFVQAGVGAMAGGVLGLCVNYYKEELPTALVIEPLNAACMYKSAEINDGSPHAVTGELDSIMAGLACGEPITEGWNILRDFAAAFCKCPDFTTARGIRILANTIGWDEHIISGESGAVGVGLLSLLIERDELSQYREKLGLNKDSIVLLFSTEGATDPENYRKILWDGKYNTPF